MIDKQGMIAEPLTGFVNVPGRWKMAESLIQFLYYETAVQQYRILIGHRKWTANRSWHKVRLDQDERRGHFFYRVLIMASSLPLFNLFI